MAKAAYRYTPKSRRVARSYKRSRIPSSINSTTNMSISGKAFPVTLMTDLKWGHVFKDGVIA